jgi:hypothetical protein
MRHTSLSQGFRDGRERFEVSATADHLEEQVKAIQKKIQQTESAFDVTTEDLFNQTIKLEEIEESW